MLRLASVVICLIVAASFLVFAVDQTGNASKGQKEAVSSGKELAQQEPERVKKESSVHRVLDEASSELTSPFSAAVEGVSSEWASRGIRLGLTLIVYGFGLGYLARAIRVRV